MKKILQNMTHDPTATHEENPTATHIKKTYTTKNPTLAIAAP